MLFSVSNTDQAPRAAMVNPFSTYLIGLCICLRSVQPFPGAIPTLVAGPGTVESTKQDRSRNPERLLNSGKLAGSEGERANSKGKGTRKKAKVCRRPDYA